MSVQSKPLYWVVCDECGERDDNDDYGFLVHDDANEAIKAASDVDWTTDGVSHHCPDCPVLMECEECGRPAGDLSGERDYHCQVCWDAAEDGAGLRDDGTYLCDDPTCGGPSHRHYGDRREDGTR